MLQTVVKCVDTCRGRGCRDVTRIHETRSQMTYCKGVVMCAVMIGESRPVKACLASLARDVTERGRSR